MLWTPSYAEIVLKYASLQLISISSLSSDCKRICSSLADLPCILRVLPKSGLRLRRFRFDENTYDGSNWIPLQNYGQANYYKMITTVDLSPRPDTGLPNSSPATTMLPIIRVQAGCSSIIRIPTIDPENDVVRCRWAEYDYNECPPYNLYGKTVCGPITPDTLLDENRCEITFSAAGNPPGWYGVSVMIEDFIDEESWTPMSRIPLQFLIYVYPFELPCRTIQVSAPLCEVIEPNEEFNARIEAFSEIDGARIVSIDTVTPLGMTRTDLQQSSDNPSKSYIDLRWTPPTNVKEETVCYYASDNNGVSSEQGCFKIVVTDSPSNGDERPEPDPLKSHPTPGELVSPTLKEWSIYYPVQVQRPFYSKKIFINTLTGGVLAELDTSEEDEVKFIINNDSGTTLNFTTPDISMPDMQPLLLEIEEGAVVSTSFGPCAQDLGSPGAGWLFTTNSSLDAPNKPTIVCDVNQMSVFIPRDYINGISARKLTLHDPNCRGRNFNETHYVVETRYDECGTVVKKKNGLLTFRNTVRDKLRPATSSRSISRRKHQIEILAKCTTKSQVLFSDDIVVNPLTVEESFQVQGEVEVVATIALFTDNTYEDVYIDGDTVDVSLKERLYVLVLANEENVALKLERCTAYAADNQGNDSNGIYIFLDNGCPVDDTFYFEEAISPNEKRFSIDAFTFLYTGIKDFITMKCSVFICDVNEADACSNQCNEEEMDGDDRGRRSVQKITDVFLDII